ncbi:MAG: HAMP domain-containing sensor histidine kinase [Ktedonobacterales bacterium]
MLQSSHPADADQHAPTPPNDREVINGNDASGAHQPQEKPATHSHRQPQRRSTLAQLAQLAETLSHDLTVAETLARLTHGALALFPQADAIQVYVAPDSAPSSANSSANSSESAPERERATTSAAPTLLHTSARTGNDQPADQPTAQTPTADTLPAAVWQALMASGASDHVFADAALAALPLRDGHGRLQGALVIAHGANDGPGGEDWPGSATPEVTILASYISAALARRTHERHVAQLAEEMAEQDRVRDSFLSLAAHELRSPLTAVKGYAQLAQRQARKQALPEKLTHSLIAIEQQTNRMSEMIGELHDATRIRRDAFELSHAPVELAPIAQQVVARSKASFPQHTITLHNEAPPLIGEWDAVRVEQVMRDLVENAARYSARGSQITLTLARQDESACIAVRDEGIGVEQADRERIFEYLYRAPNAEQRNLSGLGLSLFVCRAIVERLGGRLWLAISPLTPNGGSEFRFTLPLR